MPPASAIRRTSASESWLPDTNTNGWPIRTTRLTRLNSNGEPLEVRSPTKKSGREPTARSSAGSARRLLWRSEAITALRSSPRGCRDDAAEISCASPTSCWFSSSEMALAEPCARSIVRSATGMSGPFA